MIDKLYIPKTARFQSSDWCIVECFKRVLTCVVSKIGERLFQARVANRNFVAICVILTQFWWQLLRKDRSSHAHTISISRCELLGISAYPSHNLQFLQNHDEKAWQNDGLLLCSGPLTPDIITKTVVSPWYCFGYSKSKHREDCSIDTVGFIWLVGVGLSSCSSCFPGCFLRCSPMALALALVNFEESSL